MPKLSLGEFDALVLKAFRGVGYSWGLSQEAGRSAVWLAVRGLPASSAFVSLLHEIDEANTELLAPQLDNSALIETHKALCPLMTGTVIADFGWTLGKTVTPGIVHSPLVLVPFVASCAKSAVTALRMRLDDRNIDVNSCGEVNLTPEQCDFKQSASVVISESTESESLVVGTNFRRVILSDAEMLTLETLAHRTYVPASDQSRNNAGAGLTDND